jgi:hypothetical protein
MGPNKSTRSKPLGISKRQEKSPDNIQSVMPPRQGRSKFRQVTGRALAAYLPNCLTLLLAALLVGSIWVSPSAASPSDACRECHGAFAENHGSIDHSATLANTPMSVAPGWTYGDCGLCHFNDLITIASTAPPFRPVQRCQSERAGHTR